MMDVPNKNANTGSMGSGSTNRRMDLAASLKPVRPDDATDRLTIDSLKLPNKATSEEQSAEQASPDNNLNIRTEDNAEEPAIAPDNLTPGNLAPGNLAPGNSDTLTFRDRQIVDERSSSIKLFSGGSNSGFEKEKTVISQRPVAAPHEFYRSVPLGDLAEMLEGRQLDHFSVQQIIGGGGMGAVFRGVDQRLDRVVAIKVIPGSKRDPETLRRFQVEAQAAARLDHPNIARVFYVGEAEQWNYIVFEYIDGINIRDLVEMEGPLTIDDAVFYARQIAEALQHAHERDVVHRDIKPSNILVTPSGMAKLVDMGLARDTSLDKSTGDQTASGVTLGTFDYISPEQARNPRDADVRSDLYSLGCTLFYMLTGNPPFPEGTALQKLLNHGSLPPPDPRGWREDISDQLYDIMMKLMAKRPADRYQRPLELVNDLLLLAEQENLLRSQGPSTITLSPSIAQPTLLETHLPWMVAAMVLLGSTLWLHSQMSLSTGFAFPPINIPSADSSAGGANLSSIRSQSPGALPTNSPAIPNNSSSNTAGSSTSTNPQSPLPADSSPLKAPPALNPTVSGANGSPNTSSSNSGGPNTSSLTPNGLTQSGLIPGGAAFNGPVSNSSVMNGPGIISSGASASGLNGSLPSGPLLDGGAGTGTTTTSGVGLGGSKLPTAVADALELSGAASGTNSNSSLLSGSGSTGYGTKNAMLEPMPDPAIDIASPIPANKPTTIVVSTNQPSDISPELWEPTLARALQRLTGQRKAVEIEIRGTVALDRPLDVSSFTDLTIRGANAEARIEISRAVWNGLATESGIVGLSNCSLTLKALQLRAQFPENGLSAWRVFQLDGMSSLTCSSVEFTMQSDRVNSSFLIAAGDTTSTTSRSSEAQATKLTLVNCMVRGNGSVFRVNQSSLTGGDSVQISVNNCVMAVKGRIVDLLGSTNEVGIDRIVRFFSDRSTFVAYDGFAQLEYAGSSDPAVGFNRTSHACVYWSAPDIPHIRIVGGAGDPSDNPDQLLLQGTDNAYDQNLEHVCVFSRSNTRISELTIHNGQQDGWYAERSTERVVRWKSPPPGLTSLMEVRPADFQLISSHFVPGYRTQPSTTP